MGLKRRWFTFPRAARIERPILAANGGAPKNGRVCETRDLNFHGKEWNVCVHGMQCSLSPYSCWAVTLVVTRRTTVRKTSSAGNPATGCIIAPPDSITDSSELKVAAKLGADLTKRTKVAISVSPELEGSLKKKFEETVHSVPDTVAACHMVLA